MCNESLRLPLFPFIAQEAGNSPARGDHDETVPPLRRRIRHAVADTQTVRHMPDGCFRGKTEEGQRAFEGSPRCPAPLSAQSQLDTLARGVMPWARAELLKAHDGLRLGRTAFSNRPHFLGRLELHGDSVFLQSQRLGQPLPDCVAEILQFRPLQDHRRIHVYDPKTLFLRQVFGAPQEHQAVAAVPLGVGIGKMHPNIAQGGRAQNGVGNRVGQDVGIRVSLQAQLEGHRNSAQDQRSAGGETVYVPPEPRADFAQSPASLTVSARARPVSSWKNKRARSISPSLVILMLRSLPSTTLTSTSRRSTRLASSVPTNPSCRAASNARVIRS